MKLVKLYLSIVCYFGAGMIFIDQELEGVILENLKISEPLQKIILYLLILLWIIKIIWFVIDKTLQVQERKQKMREIDYKNKDNE